MANGSGHHDAIGLTDLGVKGPLWHPAIVCRPERMSGTLTCYGLREPDPVRPQNRHERLSQSKDTEVVARRAAVAGRRPDRSAAGAALAVHWEQRLWCSRSPGGSAGSAAEGVFCRAAVPARLAHLPLRFTAEVLAEAEDARAAATRFDAELAGIPREEAVGVADALARAEAMSSSAIEGVTVTAVDLALAEIGHPVTDVAGLVAANLDATRVASSLDRGITPEGILALHDPLRRALGHQHPAGFRNEQVWIGGSTRTPRHADFVPPHHSRVAAAVDDLCAYTSRSDLALLPQIAVAHAQFETIHPFTDGNGRTGRALAHTLLAHAGTTTRTVIPVSAGLLGDTERYIAALTSYRDGDPNPIAARFTRATFAALDNAARLARDLHQIHQQWQAALRARRDAVAWRVLPLLLRRGVTTSTLVQRDTGASQPSADNALRQLREAGVTTNADTGLGGDRKRNVIWHAPAVTDALDDFTDRVRGRRPPPSEP